MKNIIAFLIRYSYFILFLLLEVFSFTLLVRHNEFQKTSFLSSANVVTGYVLNVKANVSDYFSLKRKNLLLAKENARLHSESIYAYALHDSRGYIENDTLVNHRFRYMHARVISNSTNRSNNYIILDRGFKHGIRKDMGVIDPTGIVGIIKDVSENFCTLMPVLHKKARFNAKIKKNNYLGFLVWPGGDYRHGALKDIPAHVEVLAGDTVVTSGFSNIFPEGIPIGVIDEFELKEGDNFYTIQLRFSCDYKRIRHVYIIENRQRDELNGLIEKLRKEE